jgi:hypothetical protein
MLHFRGPIITKKNTKDSIKRNLVINWFYALNSVEYNATSSTHCDLYKIYNSWFPLLQAGQDGHREENAVALWTFY